MDETTLNRDVMMERLQSRRDPWDIVVIGGGATGLGCALDAAARGYSVVLVERGDFACGTSSRSTKLIHGGVRYLRRGAVVLVAEALRERGRLLRNAPNLVADIPFVVPTYRGWETLYLGAGLKLYDALSGKWRMGRCRLLGRDQTRAYLPTVSTRGLRGGVVYHDAQADDARLAIALAATAVDRGAVAVNYVRVVGLLDGGDTVAGVEVEDVETGATFEVPARVVINATGVYVDQVRRMDDAGAEAMIRPSRGVHVVLDRRFLPGDAALLVPNTDDARVLFLIPWHGRLLVGTTDEPVEAADDDPVPTPEEIDFLLGHAGRYLETAPSRADVLSVFAGLRPLVGRPDASDTSAISREHVVTVSPRGLLTVAGGKWTTYRKMAEDAVDQAAFIAQLNVVPSPTAQLELVHASREEHAIGGTIEPDDALVERLAQREMARSVADVLSRRTRALMLDARAAGRVAPGVAKALAGSLGRGERWQRQQIAAFEAAVSRHLPPAADNPL